MFGKLDSRRFVLSILLVLLTYFISDWAEGRGRIRASRRVPGQKVPINFNDFHGYTGAVEYIKSVARAYPNLTELIEIGKSNMSRSIYVLVVSNMQTGTTIDAHVELRNMRKENVQNVSPMKPYQGKSGHWIDGGMHGNEYTGTEVCLYIINKLVSGYGLVDEITRLVDDNTFYICPVVNPDGVFNSVERDISQRQNSEMKDDDGDGRINEDGPDDLNGDGHITQFRYKDPQGDYVIDEVDPRHMVRLGRDQTTDKQRYSVVREDKDNDGDGRRGEDDERGIDVNRNFPEGWFTDEGFAGGTGHYPTSSPEAQAICEFFTNHTNILIAQNFHTSGGFTYRPMGTAPDSDMAPRDIAVYDRIMGKKYLELIGEEIPEAWKETGSLGRFKDELRKTSKNKHAIERGYEMPRGWIHGYNENRDRRYGYGMVIDWMYAQFGAYAVTTELWNPRKDMKGIPEFTGDDAQLQRERALLKYQDEQFAGKFFIPWQKYVHPELGEGEIGGWIPKYRGGNAFPGESLIGVCETHWLFELFRAQLLPKVEVTDVQTRVLYTVNNAGDAFVTQQGNRATIRRDQLRGRYRIVEVTATIENVGKLPTHLARGAQLAGNRLDVVWLIGDRNKVTFLEGSVFQQLGVLDGTMEIPGFSSSLQNVTRNIARGLIQQFIPRQGGARQQTGNKRQARWLVAVEQNTPLKVIATSQKGGTDVINIDIR